MKVKTSKGEYFVRWQYDDEVPVLRNEKQIGTTTETTCIISKAGETVHEATVRRFHLDPDDREEARKFSLSKVLNELYPNPNLTTTDASAIKKAKNEASAEREVFWKAYRERIPKNVPDLKKTMALLVDTYGTIKVQMAFEEQAALI